MHPSDDCEDTVMASFRIGNQECYTEFCDVDEAYDWLVEQQATGTLRAFSVSQGTTVWKDSKDFGHGPFSFA